MDGINNKYNLGIEILTPLSVGAGLEKDWVKGIDYVIQNKKVYHLNLSKMNSKGVDLDRIALAFTEGNHEKVVKILGNKVKDVSDDVYDCPADTDNNIKVMVHNELSNNPILPGSSLKGAVRSVLYKYFGAKESKIGEEVLGSAKVGDDLMRFIKFSDAEFVGSKLINTKLFNLFVDSSGHWEGGWKHAMSATNEGFRNKGFNTLYECLMPGQKSYCSLMFSPSRFLAYARAEMPHSKQEAKQKILDIKGLFCAINDFTRSYLKKERDFYAKYDSAVGTELIIDAINNLLNLIPQDGSCAIMKMAAGVGFHALTGDWRFDDYANGTMDRKRNRNLNTLPKSRKIAILDEESFTPMGFIRLSVLENTADIDQKIKQSRDAANTDNLSASKIRHKPATDLAAEVSIKNNNVDKANQDQKTKENVAKELNDKLKQQDEEKWKQPLSALIAHQSSFNTLAKTVAKWIEKNPSTEFDLDYLKRRISEIYTSMKKKEQKSWTNVDKWERTFDFLDPTEVHDLFSKLVH